MGKNGRYSLRIPRAAYLIAGVVSAVLIFLLINWYKSRSLPESPAVRSDRQGETVQVGPPMVLRPSEALAFAGAGRFPENKNGQAGVQASAPLAAEHSASPAPVAAASDSKAMELAQVLVKKPSPRELSPAMPGAAAVGRVNPPSVVPDASVSIGDRRGKGEVDEEGEALPRIPVSTSPGPTSDYPTGKLAETSFGWFGWEIPPVRWGGSVGYSFQKSSSDSGQSVVSHGAFANLSASSYVYAPWLARVSGRLGMTRSTTDSQGSQGFGGNQSNGNSSIVGGAEVNMFSSTRFPFRAYFDRSDTRTSGNIVDNDYVSNRFGFTQNFRTADGSQGGNVMFDRNATRSANGERDQVSALSGAYSLQRGIVQNNINGRFSLGERSNSGERARLIGINSSHVANVSDTLNLGGTVNYSDTDIRSANGLGSVTGSRGRYLQIYGYGSWLPDFEDLDDLPLTLTGGVRYAAQDTQFGDEAFRAQSLGLNAGALYRYNSNLSLSANAAINRLVQSQGESQLLVQSGLGLNYVGKPLNFGNFSYNWNSGLGINWQSAVADTPSSSTLSGQFSHSLARNLTIFSGRNLSLTANQSVNLSNSQQLGDARSVNHTLSANMALAGGERFSGSLSAMLSDVRTTGVVEQEYRLLNLGFNGQGQLSRLSNLNVNLTFNWADQAYQTIGGVGQPSKQSNERMTLNGSAAYSHLRFAGVRGLRYNLTFVADTRLRDERLLGNVNGDIDRARFSLTNRLEYSIGMLDLRLSLVNNDVGGKKNALLFFQVSRQLGSY